MELAYDDFGAGQARLVVLTEVPPDFLKFDRGLVGGIEQAPASRMKLVEGLVTVAADLGIATIAEGIESEGEKATCRQLGFSYGQGYHLGRPAPAETFVDSQGEAPA